LAAAATVSFETADATRWPFTTVVANKAFKSGAGDTAPVGVGDPGGTDADADFTAGTAVCFTGPGAGVVEAVPAALAAVDVEGNPTETNATMTATAPPRHRTRIPASERRRAGTRLTNANYPNKRERAPYYKYKKRVPTPIATIPFK
jgi:hypothetical protein